MNDEPLFQVVVNYYDHENCTQVSLAIKTFKQPKNAFKMTRALSKLELNMFSDEFDLAKYESIDGFLSDKFWKSNIFSGIML